MRKSITSLRPYLSQGIKELEIPALNPLVIPEIKLSQNSGAVTLESTYKDIVIYGATRFRLRSVKVDLDQNKMRCKLWFPELQLRGKGWKGTQYLLAKSNIFFYIIPANYNLNGKLLMMPLQGSGTCHGNFSEFN